MIKFFLRGGGMFQGKTVHLMIYLIIAGTHILSGAFSFAEPEKFSIDSTADPIEQALAKVNLTRETATYENFTMKPEMLSSSVKELFFRYVRSPFKTPYYLAHFKQNYLEYEGAVHDTLMYMTSGVDEGVSRGYKSEPLKPLETLSQNQDAVFEAISALYEIRKQTISDEEARMLKSEIAKLPENLRQPIAYFLYVCADAIVWRMKSLRKCSDDDFKKLINNPADVYSAAQKYIDEIEEGLDKFDFKNFYCGALDLASGADKLIPVLKKYKSDNSTNKKFRMEADTPLGMISISDDGDTSYSSDRKYILIIDFSGNDFYPKAASASEFDTPVSVSFDLSGNDIYGEVNSKDKGLKNIACGILGYGYLFDFEGDDKYLSSGMAQAFSFLGVGILYDEKGADVYESKELSQGAAMLGLSLLVDKDGSDKYFSVSASQGFGWTKGYGLLVDSNGDDSYILDDENIVRPAAQTKKHNQSMGQGFGLGYRGDQIDGHSLNGGLGRLWDMAGNDTYIAGVFAQGSGFWSGCGMLIDSKGNDKYRSAYYVMGSGAHTALGLFMDEEGDDSYIATDYMAIGSGHDFTLGFFIDKAGNDIYEFPSSSMGNGKDNGMGIFIDIAGDDKYISKDNGVNILGSYSNSKTGTLREDMFSLGFFADLSGNDSYSIKGVAVERNNLLWREELLEKDYDLPFQKGVGIDGNFEKFNLLLNVITKSVEK